MLILVVQQLPCHLLLIATSALELQGHETIIITTPVATCTSTLESINLYQDIVTMACEQSLATQTAIIQSNVYYAIQ